MAEKQHGVEPLFLSNADTPDPSISTMTVLNAVTEMIDAQCLEGVHNFNHIHLSFTILLLTQSITHSPASPSLFPPFPLGLILTPVTQFFPPPIPLTQSLPHPHPSTHPRFRFKQSVIHEMMEETITAHFSAWLFGLQHSQVHLGSRSIHWYSASPSVNIKTIK